MNGLYLLVLCLFYFAYYVFSEEIQINEFGENEGLPVGQPTGPFSVKVINNLDQRVDIYYEGHEGDIYMFDLAPTEESRMSSYSGHSFFAVYKDATDERVASFQVHPKQKSYFLKGSVRTTNNIMEQRSNLQRSKASKTYTRDPTLTTRSYSPGNLNSLINCFRYLLSC